MSVVLISMTFQPCLFALENDCDTNERSFTSVQDNVVTQFSFLALDQKMAIFNSYPDIMFLHFLEQEESIAQLLSILSAFANNGDSGRLYHVD